MKQSNRKLWDLWGQTNALYTQWCSENNVNYYRYLILYVLDDNESITQKQISDSTGLSRQTVSSVIRSLKAEGIITLHSATKDRREKYIRMTDEGKFYAVNVLKKLYEIESRVFDMIGEERIKQMLDEVSLFNTVFEKEAEKMKNEQQNEQQE